MSTVSHGQSLRLEDVLQAAAPHGLAVASEVSVVMDFDYMFHDDLAGGEPLERLPKGMATITNLRALGDAMGENGSDADAKIPAAYTYFGQFVDHDITKEAKSDNLRDIQQGDFEPLSGDEIHQNLKNVRTAPFDLDSLYAGLAERDGAKMKVGPASGVPSQFGIRPAGKADPQDLPRSNKVAQIGDPRNDENTIISQLHFAFLQFHNALVGDASVNPEHTFEVAQKLVRQHYQWVVIEDFLKRIVDPQLVEQSKTERRFFNPLPDQLFMPLEFSVAAYRFGHSMVRAFYNFNVNFQVGSDILHEGRKGKASLSELFIFTQFSGPLGAKTLPQNWIIEWENFLELKTGFPFEQARTINTHLTPPLFELRDPGGVIPNGLFKHLAQRNLLRGYLLDLPTGQSIARRIVDQEGVLTPDEILTNALASTSEHTALLNGNFHIQTPLWYYILAEAAIKEQGQRLGIVGGTIVAETILGLIEQTPDSILKEKDWKPTLPTQNADGKFDLRDIIRIAGLVSQAV